MTDRGAFDFRYVPSDGGGVRAGLWLSRPGDEAPLRSYAATHDMVVTGLYPGDAGAVRAAAEAGAINLVLAWRVASLAAHPLRPHLAELRRAGVEFMSVLEL